ncbi:MAG: acyltransferase [Peptococcaceae bacterium]|nr:acyltransferase [Peptococcaceae bacterium]
MQGISNLTQYVYYIFDRGLKNGFLMSSVSLKNILEKGYNNFDLVRLICACMVIYGHAFAVAPESGNYDLIHSITGFNAAAIAVKIFFFISGLLVTNSLIEKKSLIAYFIARFFRIWPALIFVLLFSAFVIGPALTTLDLNTYFSNPNTYLYIKNQILMKSWGTQALGNYDLPGVFT